MEKNVGASGSFRSGRARALSLVLAGGALLAFGCVGTTGERPDDSAGEPGDRTKPGNGTEPGNGKKPGDTATPGEPGAPTAAVAPLRRLTADQYRNTVRDLLGVQDPIPATALPGDDAVADRFFSNVDSPVKMVDLERYGDLAETLAGKAVVNLGALLPCQGQDAACAGRFIETFGRRAYRRPLTPIEVERLKKVHAAGGSFADGVQMVIVALLQSPKFLYLPEPVPAGSGGKVVAVDGWAMASRLSYFLLSTMPDDALLDAAADGTLGTAEQVAAQATRLMGDQRFRATVNTFHQQWLSLHELGGAEKDGKLFASWNEALKTALGEESRRFVEHVFTEGDGRLETLLGAPYSILGGPLYDHYGAPKPANLNDWQRTSLNKDQRAGLLTQGAMLAAQAHADHTSYILRGKLVREALFCSKIPAPPADAANNEMNLPPTATARERAAVHRVKPECASCHELFDPIGFAFENYDAIGRWRDKEANGKAIDATAEITKTEGLDGPVANAVELVKKLSTSDEIRNCVATQWQRFALGRQDADDDQPSLTAAQKTFKASNGKIADLLMALARSDAFRYQRVAAQ